MRLYIRKYIDFVYLFLLFVLILGLIKIFVYYDSVNENSVKYFVDMKQNELCLKLYLKETKPENVRVGIWSGDGNDLRWHSLIQEQDCIWTCNINLTTIGILKSNYFHFYGDVNGTDTFLNETSIFISRQSVSNNDYETDNVIVNKECVISIISSTFVGALVFFAGLICYIRWSTIYCAKEVENDV